MNNTNNDHQPGFMTIELPDAPIKGGLYKPCHIEGNTMYVSGCGCNLNGSNYQGKLGQEFTLSEGVTFAENSMLNVLAVVKEHLGGDLSRVNRFLNIRVYVASTNEFYEQPQVANGATALLERCFGKELGLPTRTAFGVNVLPGNIPVEIDAILSVDPL